MQLVEQEAERAAEPVPRLDPALRDRARLGVLAEVSLLLASPGDQVTILQRLTELAVPALADWCAVHLVRDGGVLEQLAIRHADPKRPPIADPRGIARVAAKGTSECGVLTPEEHYVAVPLSVRGRVIGVLSLVRAAIPYEGEERAFAEELARRVAMYVDNAMLLREVWAREAALRDEATRLETLNRIGLELSALHDLDELVDKVCEAATALTGAELGVYVAFDRGATKIAISGADSGERAQLERGCAELSPEQAAEQLPGLFAGVARAASTLAVPVRGRRGDVIGAIALACSRPLAFDRRAEQLVAGLASLTATATDSARLFHEAHALIAALEKTNRELDQFAYVASHDLRAPLRGIANLAGWIEEDLRDRLTPASRHHLHLLRGRVRRLDALIQGVLEYSRAGQLVDAPTEVDLGALVREVIELVDPPAGFEVVLAPALPKLHAPRVPLQQVLMNLVGNAIKHASSPVPRVEIGATATDEGWELYVRDNGPGIAPCHHDRIWVLFQTLQPRDRVESTGIGLAIVRKIVEAHGGRAWVESREGEGATFRFTWPRQPPGAPSWP